MNTNYNLYVYYGDMKLAIYLGCYFLEDLRAWRLVLLALTTAGIIWLEKVFQVTVPLIDQPWRSLETSFANGWADFLQGSLLLGLLHSIPLKGH